MKTLLLLLVTAAVVCAEPILYTVGPDADPFFPVPRSLASMDAASGSASGVTLLGDGTLGFTGLLYRDDTGLFYAVGNDGSMSNSTLYSFGTDGALNSVETLGDFFTGGLAWSGSAYYAIGGVPGAQSLYAYDPLGSEVATVGTLDAGAAFAGLVWDSANSNLYGIGSDFTGASTLYLISTTDGGTTAQSVSLGYGFTGGLALEASSSTFYTIASDFLGDSYLYSFLLTDSAASEIRQVGSGLMNAGLTMAPATTGDPEPIPVSEVPEPTSFVLLGGGLAGLFLYRRRRA